MSYEGGGGSAQWQLGNESSRGRAELGSNDISIGPVERGVEGHFLCRRPEIDLLCSPGTEEKPPPAIRATKMERAQGHCKRSVGNFLHGPELKIAASLA